MLATVWLRPGILMIYSASGSGIALDAANHKHNAIQVVCPKNGGDTAPSVNKLEVEGAAFGMTGAVMVGAQVQHSLLMDVGWLLLVEPQSDLGNAMASLLAEASAIAIRAPDLPPAEAGTPVTEVLSILSPLMASLGFESVYTSLISGRGRTSSLDLRTQRLMDILDEAFDEEEVVEGKHLSAAAIADQLALSESRFLHLFRQEMSIAWRPYLLWRRMMCALNAIISGISATEASYLAGFSDSAHLSRTFRSQFGMSIRQAQGLFKADRD